MVVDVTIRHEGKTNHNSATPLVATAPQLNKPRPEMPEFKDLWELVTVGALTSRLQSHTQTRQIASLPLFA
jgi:hypothetical protein